MRRRAPGARSTTCSATGGSTTGSRCSRECSPRTAASCCSTSSGRSADPQGGSGRQPLGRVQRLQPFREGGARGLLHARGVLLPLPPQAVGVDGQLVQLVVAV